MSSFPVIEVQPCQETNPRRAMRWAVAASILIHTCGLLTLAARYSTRVLLPTHVSASHATDTILLNATVEEAVPLQANSLLAESAVTILPHRATMGSHVFYYTPSTDVALSDLLTEVTLADNLEPPAKTHDNQQPTIPLLAETIHFIEEELPAEKATVKPASQAGETTAKLTPPDLNGNALPRYPEQARRLGWEGRVLLRIWINQQGTVTQVEVEETSGYSLLDAAAVSSVRTWRVQPAQRNGQPVAGSWLLPIRFRQP